ncbi:MAG: hypothetical protein II058_02340 [Rhodocyclaceae bacterium]|nr:hypothetical protein [Rhodocyclaceae bacterium]
MRFISAAFRHAWENCGMVRGWFVDNLHFPLSQNFVPHLRNSPPTVCPQIFPQPFFLVFDAPASLFHSFRPNLFFILIYKYNIKGKANRLRGALLRVWVNPFLPVKLPFFCGAACREV